MVLAYKICAVSLPAFGTRQFNNCAYTFIDSCNCFLREFKKLSGLMLIRDNGILVYSFCFGDHFSLAVVEFAT